MLRRLHGGKGGNRTRTSRMESVDPRVLQFVDDCAEESISKASGSEDISA